MSLGYIGDSLPKGWCTPLLSELATPKQWKTIPTKSLLSEGYTVYGANGKIGYFDQYTHKNPTIMITCRGATCGNLHISEPFSYINGNAMALDDQPTKLAGLKFLYFALKARGLEDTISGSAQPQITGKGLSEVRLPLPPSPNKKSSPTNSIPCWPRWKTPKPDLNASRKSSNASASPCLLRR